MLSYDKHWNWFQERVSAVVDAADQFSKMNHFHADAIQEKKDRLVERYSQLEEPVSKREQALEDSRLYQQFLHDVEDEEMWIKEKEPLASSMHTGTIMRRAEH